MKSIDELENDPSNNLVCGLWDEVYDEKNGERLICPWCGTSIELDPEGVAQLYDVNEYKTECPECGQTIYFRAEPEVNLYSKRQSHDPNNAIEFY